MVEGDIVRHTTYPGRLKIKVIHGDFVAILLELDKEKEWNSKFGEYMFPTIIARLENLTPEILI